MSKTRLEKHLVCTACFAVGIPDPDCICTYQDGYDELELEFEVCTCCGQLVEDGYPADTKFNKEQLKK